MHPNATANFPVARRRRAPTGGTPLLSRTRVAVLVVIGLVTLSACGDDDSSPGAPSAEVSPVVAGAAFPDDRCAANRAAGTIEYYSGFDFAAAASIVEVLVAKERGYYDELCLDVRVRSSFSAQNYPFVAANTAQFASGGSFSEIVDFAEKNQADFVAASVTGRAPIDALIVKDGLTTTLEDLRGTTIGVKGKITPAVAAMLAQAGLVEDEDYDTLLLDGFNPLAHIEVPIIAGFPGWKSNEPGQLERAGVPFDLYDPADLGIPGSFGVIFTNTVFRAEHPTAYIDFLRATMRGLADAVADPTAAAELAVGFINSGGNPNFLSPEGEVFRWTTEADMISGDGPSDLPLGVPDRSLLHAEVEAFAAVGLFGGQVPGIDGRYDDSWTAEVYDVNGRVIWPG